MNYVVLSRAEIEKYTAFQPYIVISIRWPRDLPPKLLEDSYRKNVLYLSFEDTDNINSIRPFSIEDAEKILTFIETHPFIENCVIHCSAGISRSRAVALALTFLYNLDYQEHLIQGYANPLVVYLLCKYYADTKKQPLRVPIMIRPEVWCDEHPNIRVRRHYDDNGNLLLAHCQVCKKNILPQNIDILKAWIKNNITA